MGLQRVGEDSVTEKQQQQTISNKINILSVTSLLNLGTYVKLIFV